MRPPPLLDSSLAPSLDPAPIDNARSARCPPRSRSLSLHLLGVTAVVLALAGATVVGIVAAVLRWGPDLAQEIMLDNNVEQVIEGLRFDANGRPYAIELSRKMLSAYEVLKKDCVYRILDEHGTVLLSSDDASVPYTAPGAGFDATRTRLSLLQDGEALEVVLAGFQHQGHQLYAQVMRSQRLQRIALDDKGQRVRSLTLTAAIVGMVLFSLIVVATLHYLLKPLRRAAAIVTAIEPDNISSRLSLQDVPRELAPLFLSFNHALDRLEHGYRLQREFLATAAHELKTPLALMRGQVELGELNEPGQRAMLLQDIDQMTRQVQQLLHLAEVSERQNYAMQEVDAHAVLGQAAAQLERLAQRGAVNLVLATKETAQDATTRADAAALSVLSKNLVENAIHHSPPGGTVWLQADHAGLTVRDEGTGIPVDAMPHLFERFWRGQHRRDQGAGLGLSICAEIAKAHGWTLRATNTPAGALFEVRF